MKQMHPAKKTRPVLGLAFILLMAGHGFGASIPEPETSIYGQVISRDGTQSHVVTEGRLTWKVRRPDASEETFETNLTELDPIRKAIQTERFLDFRLWGQVMGQAGGVRRGIEGLLNDRIV